MNKPIRPKGRIIQEGSRTTLWLLTALVVLVLGVLPIALLLIMIFREPLIPVKNSFRRKSQIKVSSSLKRRTQRIKASKDFTGRGITPKAGQWYINKECLAEKRSDFIFAYRVRSIIKANKRKQLPALCTADRIEQKNSRHEVLQRADFVMLPAAVFKAVDETTIAAYLL